MNSRELKAFLNTQILIGNKDPFMVSGPPGCAKSSVVAQVAADNDLQFVDLRISQLAPTDLRGIPAVDIHNEVFKYLPPDFLPKVESAPGILFLDELTQAVPAVQAIAQQLILDRRVGSYIFPSNWFIWAAGNRAGDRSASFSMIKSLGNRFNHLQVEPDHTCWLQDFALANLSAEICAFISFRPDLIHKMLEDSDAWPSPRSWEMANRLHLGNCNIAPAVGEAAACEFNSFLKNYKYLPDLQAIYDGNGSHIKFPKDLSVQYATTVGLLKMIIKSKGPEIINCLEWLLLNQATEHAAMFAAELRALDGSLKDWNGYRYYISQLSKNPKLVKLSDDIYTATTPQARVA
jgi:ATPase family associated with various cellular activities (AAA)